MRETKNHYSIRKLTIGAASVLIGVSFFGVKADTVRADVATHEAENSVNSKDLDANKASEAGQNLANSETNMPLNNQNTETSGNVEINKNASAQTNNLQPQDGLNSNMKQLTAETKASKIDSSQAVNKQDLAKGDQATDKKQQNIL